jgi:predicted PurR-regulated permease PerM
MSERSPATKQADHLRFLLTLILAIGGLYLGRSVILPLALSILLAFILTPLVIAVQKRGLQRVPAVLVVLCCTFILAAGVGYGVGTQVGKLANQLPDYARAINGKISKVRSSDGGPFSRAMAALQGAGAAADRSAGTGHGTQPTVVVQPAESSAFDRLSTVAVAVLEPVADAALVLVLVSFMLIRREDLRNRIIGLLGHGRLTGTTRVFVESAERISRLLLMQLCVNTAFGTVFGLVLLSFGVPYWFLWGFLCVLLRFIPYVGTWIAAMLPVLLSFAVFPGFARPLGVFASFFLLDLVTGNVIEPLLFGHSTGVTPVALLVAAIFWTWVWGPLGLVLSTPLTVCLVVMGQNVPSLRWLSLLMGDEAALEPHAAYYQRLLAGDRSEAMLIARQYAAKSGYEELPDAVVVPALRMARQDRKHSGLSPADEAFVFDTTEEVITTLEKKIPVVPSDGSALVLGCPAHHRAEELTLHMLASTLAPTCCLQTVSTRLLPVEIEASVEREKPAIVFIAIVPPGGVNQAMHLCRRLRRRFADLKIVVGYFGKIRDFDQLLTRLRAAGASYVSTSVIQSRNQIRSLLPATLEPTPMPPTPPTASTPLPPLVELKTSEVVIVASTPG